MSFPYLRIICTGVMLCVLSCSLNAQTPPVDSVKVESAAMDSIAAKNPKGAMLRSLAVPGWGQFYNGKWLKGIAVAGAEVGLVANAIVLNGWADESTTADERAYYLDNRNLQFWILGAVILYSMADAYVDASLYDFDESPELTLNIKTIKEPLVGIATKIYHLNVAIRL